MSDDLTERENRSRILSLLQLGGSHASNGDPVGAEAAFEEAAALARAAGLQEETECLYQLGSQRALRGAVSSARACFQEGLGIGRRAGLHQMAARHLVGLAELDDRESDEAGAFAHYACALIFLTTTDQDEYHLAVVVAQRVGQIMAAAPAAMDSASQAATNLFGTLRAHFSSSGGLPERFLPLGPIVPRLHAVGMVGSSGRTRSGACRLSFLGALEGRGVCGSGRGGV